uniref:CCHC-type domain-containing protein n=1 Tax=Hyaloperonospora arabidopsidis (strain Emoy2) TaxID=559515 RepID=M4BYR8_HYAAE
MAKYDMHRVNYLVHAEEMAHFAQAIELEAQSRRSFVREFVVHVDESTIRKDTSACYGCGKVGYVKSECRSKSTGGVNGGRHDRRDSNMVLSIGEGKGSKGLRTVKNNMAMEIGYDGGHLDNDVSSVEIPVSILSTIIHFCRMDAIVKNSVTLMTAKR